MASTPLFEITFTACPSKTCFAVPPLGAAASRPMDKRGLLTEAISPTLTTDPASTLIVAFPPPFAVASKPEAFGID